MTREAIALRRRLAAAGALLFAAALLLYPQACAQSARQGLLLCGNALIPSLFPFFILSDLLVSLGLCEKAGRALGPVMRPLFHLSGSGAAVFALGLVGGYPAGAQAAAALCRAGRVSRQEAARLARFCNNAGPAFIFGVLGAGVFGRPALGLLLFAAHAAGAMLTGVLLRPKTAPPVGQADADGAMAAPGPGEALIGAVRRAGAAVLQVCMFVVFFSVLTGVLQALPLPPLPDALRPLFVGALELSGGAAALKTAGLPLPLALAEASFLLGFGGCSVQLQTRALLAEYRIPVRGLLTAKLLHGLLSAALAWLCAFFLFPSGGRAALFGFLRAHAGPLFCFAGAGLICLLAAKIPSGNRREKRV